MHSQQLAGPRAKQLDQNTEQHVASGRQASLTQDELFRRLERQRVVNPHVFHDPRTQMPIYTGPSREEQLQRALAEAQAKLQEKDRLLGFMRDALDKGYAREAELGSQLGKANQLNSALNKLWDRSAGRANAYQALMAKQRRQANE